MSDQVPTPDEVLEWVAKNWPDETEMSHRFDALWEEGGEMSRANTKRRHGHRGTYDQWTAEFRKEFGDVMIVLWSMAADEGFDPIKALSDRWLQVKDRDLNHDPLPG